MKYAKSPIIVNYLPDFPGRKTTGNPKTSQKQIQSSGTLAFDSKELRKLPFEIYQKNLTVFGISILRIRKVFSYILNHATLQYKNYDFYLFEFLIFSEIFYISEPFGAKIQD